MDVKELFRKVEEVFDLGFPPDGYTKSSVEGEGKAQEGGPSLEMFWQKKEARCAYALAERLFALQADEFRMLSEFFFNERTIMKVSAMVPTEELNELNVAITKRAARWELWKRAQGSSWGVSKISTLGKKMYSQNNFVGRTWGLSTTWQAREPQPEPDRFETLSCTCSVDHTTDADNHHTNVMSGVEVINMSVLQRKALTFRL